mmetsp:Transcript_26447/g.29670  ORF Transcript_26447/g.29670 Transcript_26447/m.29670 type:complete len:290 (-) Transcript_26447:164-1033(-)|eukprot:CAMPEP_0170791138 /NCGR_PEP_ID=MMETSP0733-20121128/20941_1 /TAXON_ID=186038 /ORGANISM="Fragilariopsis kerguelensis, Strain L26-C5" /LENGTH=289 /DNA_ID=CAMNT_0011138961 /DNA_START=45 /DNA_END=914 /DNA_ORIENTATION=+
MKLQFPSIFFLSSLLLIRKQVHAFSSTRFSSRKRVIDSTKHHIVLSAETATQGSSPKNRPLTPKEILARQREKEGLPADVDDHPKLYDDELRGNMQQILLTLEKRVQEGPGLNSLEVEEFVVVSQNVLAEMKQKEYERLEDASSSSTSTSSKLVDSTPGNTMTTTESGNSKNNDLPQQSASISESASVTTIEESKSGDTGSDAGSDDPAYSPSGGNGSLAKGTANTYVIPNMDEMSPEEYREALQQSIFDRQSKRKESGSYGNRQTWDYLNNLTGGGSGPLKKEKKEEE